MLQSLYTGLSGLLAHQKALDVTANNIGNYNNSDYIKRTVNFTDNPVKSLQDAALNRIGSGTHVQSIQRVKDEFLYNHLNSSKEHYGLYQEQASAMRSVNEEVTKEDFSSIYDTFFESLNRQVNMPHNIELKYIAEQNGKNLVKRAEEIQEIFKNQVQENNEKTKIFTDEKTLYTKELDNINLEIKKLEALNEFKTDKTYANSLRDKKDSLEVKIIEKDAAIKSLTQSSKDLTSLNDTFNDLFSKDYSGIKEWLSSDKNSEDGLKLLDEEENIKNNQKDFIQDIGFKFNTLDTMLGSSETIMNNLQDRYNEKSKVNLDEEMTNQIRFQRAYEASAIVIRTADEILKTTLDIKR